MYHQGTNVLSFQGDLRGRWWFIFICYRALDDTDTFERITTAIGQRLHGAALVVVHNFNTNLTTLEGSSRREEILAVTTAARLEGMSAHFLLRRKYWVRDRKMWCMHHLGREVCSRTDYLLVTNSRLLRNVFCLGTPAQSRLFHSSGVPP